MIFPDVFLLPGVPGICSDDDDVEDDDDKDSEEDEDAPCSFNWSFPAPILLVSPTPGIVLPTDGGDCVRGGVLAGDVPEGGDGDGVDAITPQAAWCFCSTCQPVSSS